MNNNTSDDNSPSEDKQDELSLFNYKLNDIDRLSGLLFALALGLLFHQADLTDESIWQTQSGEATLEENTLLNHAIAKELADMSRINLMAGLLSFYTTTERLKQLEALIKKNPTASIEERLEGREMVTMANTLAVIAFTLSINGYELIADGILRQQTETPPP